MMEIDALRAVADAAVELRRKLEHDLVQPCPACGSPTVAHEALLLEAYENVESAEQDVLEALREYWQQEGI